MPKSPLIFTDQLRAAIDDCGKSRYQISQETGISQAVLSRFMHHKGGLSVDSIDTLCKHLKLKLSKG